MEPWREGVFVIKFLLRLLASSGSGWDNFFLSFRLYFMRSLSGHAYCSCVEHTFNLYTYIVERNSSYMAPAASIGNRAGAET